MRRIGSIYGMHSDGVISNPIAVDDRSLAAVDNNFIGRSSEFPITHTKVTESLFITLPLLLIVPKTWLWRCAECMHTCSCTAPSSVHEANETSAGNSHDISPSSFLDLT
jgi:hypothetical protein